MSVCVRERESSARMAERELGRNVEFGVLRQESGEGGMFVQKMGGGRKKARNQLLEKTSPKEKRGGKSDNRERGRGRGGLKASMCDDVFGV